MPDKSTQMSRRAHDDVTVQLVVPCYNEAKRLDTRAFDLALETMPWLSLTFVNDGSSDNTQSILESFEQANPGRVNVLALERNAGKAEAVRQGLLTVATGTALCGFWDADLAAPLGELPALRNVLLQNPQYEWAWGIRLQTLGRRIARRPLRHYLGRVFATAVSLVVGVASYDTQCGAKLFRQSPLLRAVINERFYSRWIFDVEMMSRAVSMLRASKLPGVEALVIEQPLSAWEDRGGSKVRSTDFARAVAELVGIWTRRDQWSRQIENWQPSPVAGEA